MFQLPFNKLTGRQRKLLGSASQTFATFRSISCEENDESSFLNIQSSSWLRFTAVPYTKHHKWNDGWRYYTVDWFHNIGVPFHPIVINDTPMNSTHGHLSDTLYEQQTHLRCLGEKHGFHRFQKNLLWLLRIVMGNFPQTYCYCPIKRVMVRMRKMEKTACVQDDSPSSNVEYIHGIRRIMTDTPAHFSVAKAQKAMKAAATCRC